MSSFTGRYIGQFIDVVQETGLQGRTVRICPLAYQALTRIAAERIPPPLPVRIRYACDIMGSDAWRKRKDLLAHFRMTGRVMTAPEMVSAFILLAGAIGREILNVLADPLTVTVSYVDDDYECRTRDESLMFSFFGTDNLSGPIWLNGTPASADYLYRDKDCFAFSLR